MLAAAFDAADHRHGTCLTADSEAGAEPGSERDEDEEENEEEDNENGEGPISKRLRLRKGCPPMAEDGEDISADEDYQDLPGLVDRDSSDDDDDGNQCGVNTAAARARRAAAARAIDDDDPLEDVRPQPTSRTQQTHIPQANEALPLVELSVTLSKHRGHVNPAWLTLVHDWMKLRCKAGAVAAERGGKAQHLHLQIILRMHIAEMDIDALKTELKTLVGWQRGDGSGTYCQAKQFGVGQARASREPATPAKGGSLGTDGASLSVADVDYDAGVSAQGSITTALSSSAP